MRVNEAVTLAHASQRCLELYPCDDDDPYIHVRGSSSMRAKSLIVMM